MRSKSILHFSSRTSCGTAWPLHFKFASYTYKHILIWSSLVVQQVTYYEYMSMWPGTMTIIISTTSYKSRWKSILVQWRTSISVLPVCLACVCTCVCSVILLHAIARVSLWRSTGSYWCGASFVLSLCKEGTGWPWEQVSYYLMVCCTVDHPGSCCSHILQFWE